MAYKISHTKTVAVSLFGVLMLTTAFWFLANHVNVYKHAVMGALFEIVWLPVIMLTFAVPVAALIYWYREKFSIKSAFLYIAIIAIFLNVYYFTR